MPKRNVFILLALLFFSVGCDQVSKQAAVHWLSGAPSTSYLGDTFRLTYMENHGAFLGMGSTWPEPLRWSLFTLLSTALVLGALAFTLHGTQRAPSARAWGPHWGTLLIAAGGLGNLIDRVLRDGAVVDFMNMGIGSLRTGVFNVADVYIMCGIALWAFWPKRSVVSSRA